MQLPASIATPATAPSSSPFEATRTAVPIPAVIPSAKATIVTRMLLVNNSALNAASRPAVPPS